MTREEWESKCNKCGKCCYRLVTLEDGTHSRHDTQHCDYFNSETKMCNVYEDRFRIYPNCMELFELMIPMCRNGFLPENCGYLRNG